MPQKRGVNVLARFSGPHMAGACSSSRCLRGDALFLLLMAACAVGADVPARALPTMKCKKDFSVPKDIAMKYSKDLSAPKDISASGMQAMHGIRRPMPLMAG